MVMMLKSGGKRGSQSPATKFNVVAILPREEVQDRREDRWRTERRINGGQEGGRE